MKARHLAFFVVFIFALFVMIEPAMAGPGGKIANALAGTFWGKVLMLLMFVFFLPLILYVVVVESLSTKRARRDLRFMAGYSALFDWLNIQQRAKDCFLRVHSAWNEENMCQASQWMTDWYWQNQQLAHLDKWRHEGLVNICNVKKVKAIRPILFVHRNYGQAHEGSIVVVSITAHMQDYLQHRSSGRLVEGDKTYKDVETIWTLTLDQGAWKVSDIEESSLSLSYSKMAKELPKIETTVISDFKA